MFKYSLAVLALIGVLDTEAISVHQKQASPHPNPASIPMEEDEPNGHHQVLTPEDNKDYLKQDFGMVELPQDDMNVQVESQEGSSSCTSGISRWGQNKFSTFKAAHNGATQWTDTTFAGQSSLWWDGFTTSYTKSDVDMWKKYINKYARTKEWYPSDEPSLWGTSGKPRPEGITQAYLGDCWFLAGASALAENPDRVKRIVWNNSYNKNGAFRFYFWSKDRWHAINVDDKFPIYSSGSRRIGLMTHRSKAGKAMWMPLMEKAYAKLDQTYERIIGGYGWEGLRTLTAMPTTLVWFSKAAAGEQNLWNVLKPLAAKNYPMTSGCCVVSKPHGNVYSGHAYSLLDLVELKGGKYDGMRLAKIRNPHDRERYRGEWHDADSSRWTAEYKSQAGYKANNYNDGVFFLPFKYYVKEWMGASAALYQAYAGFKQMEGTGSKTFTISNPQSQEFYVHVDTYGYRNYPRTCTTELNKFMSTLYDPSGAKVKMFTGNTLNMGYSIYGQGWTFHGSLEKPLGGGNYRLTVQPYSGKKTQPYTVNVYWKDKEGTIA